MHTLAEPLISFSVNMSPSVIERPLMTRNSLFTPCKVQLWLFLPLIYCPDEYTIGQTAFRYLFFSRML